MTTEVVEKVDYTGKSVYYPARNTTHTTTTYKINGVTYQEEINLKQGEGEFLTTNYISKQNSDGSTSVVPSTSSEFLDIALHANRTSALTTTYNDVEETSKNLGKFDKFTSAVEESGMNVVMETGNFNTVVPNRVIQDQKLAEEAALSENSNEETGNVIEPNAKRPSWATLANVNLQYPKYAMYGEGQDYLYIQQFEYKPPQAKSFGKEKNNGAFSLKKSVEELGDSSKDSIVHGLSRGSNIRKPAGAVKLPVPNGLSVSNGVGWGEGRANAVEAGAFFQAMGSAEGLITGEKSVASIIGDNFKAAGGLLDNLKDNAREGGSASTVLSAVLAKAALAKLNINVDPAQFITRATGNAINPNLELLFTGPKLRNFTFSYMLASEDKDEAADVRKIIRWFKQGMSPKKDFKDRIYLGSPNVFRLKYMNAGRRIKGLNLFKICALTACELDFAPSKTWQSYEDSSAVSMPPLISMALSFTELTPIFSADYTNEAGEDNTSYGDLGLSGNNNIGPEDVGF